MVLLKIKIPHIKTEVSKFSRRIRKGAFMLIILGSAHGVYAQSMDSFREQTDITPSVETWKMTRHGGLSPSLYTGAMQ